jgi:hypothetical protein
MVRVHRVQADLARAPGDVDGERHETHGPLPDRDDRHVMAGAGGADVGQELGLVGVGLSKGQGGDLGAHGCAERPEHRLDRGLAVALERGKVARPGRPDARVGCRHAGRSLMSWPPPPSRSTA